MQRARTGAKTDDVLLGESPRAVMPTERPEGFQVVAEEGSSRSGGNSHGLSPLPELKTLRAGR